VTRYESLPVLENNPFIDRLLPYCPETVARLLVEKFDLVISLDKEPDSTALAELADAPKKAGFGLSRYGKPYPLNKQAEYAFALGISDNLKFRLNKKTYPQLIFEMAGLKYKGEEYILNLSKEQLAKTGKFRKLYGIKAKDRVIGFNTGCGDAFQGKKWTADGFLKLGLYIRGIRNTKSLLLGGPNEVERNSLIAKSARFPIIDTGCGNTMRDFLSIVNLCDLVVCGDTVTMHIAIALKKRVVALFGPTVAQEVELYGRGEKIVGKAPCGPCYKRVCSRNDLCMKDIKPEAVFRAVKSLI
jgi:heptosyltransferase-2